MIDEYMPDDDLVDDKRIVQVSRGGGQVVAALQFDQDNKAVIALAKEANFEDLMQALGIVDPGIIETARSLGYGVEPL